MPMTPRLKKEGDPLTVGDVNFMLEAATRNVTMPVGYVSQNAHAHGDPTPGPFRIAVKHDGVAEVPAWSVFTIKYDERDYNAAFIRPDIAKIGNDGTPLLLLTNEGEVIKPSTWGHGRPIGFHEPFRVKVTSEIPVGHSCGVKPDDYTVTPDAFGLVALSKRDPTFLTQMVMRATEPTGFIGTVTEAITAAAYTEGAPPTWTLGTGKVKLLRKAAATNLLENVKNPGEPDVEGTPVPWDVPVYSRRSWQVPINTTVRGCYVMGIGLVIDDNPGALFGKTQSGGASVNGAGVLDLLKMDGSTERPGTVDFSNLIGTAISANKKVLAIPEAFTLRLVAVEKEESCDQMSGYVYSARQMLVKQPNTQCPVLVTVAPCEND